MSIGRKNWSYYSVERISIYGLDMWRCALYDKQGRVIHEETYWSEEKAWNRLLLLTELNKQEVNT
jgi:hypothetical protein